MSVTLLPYSKENVHRHILRMLLHLHHKVAPSYMESLMKTLEPPKQVGLINELMSFLHTPTPQLRCDAALCIHRAVSH